MLLWDRLRTHELNIAHTHARTHAYGTSPASARSKRTRRNIGYLSYHDPVTPGTKVGPRPRTKNKQQPGGEHPSRECLSSLKQEHIGRRTNARATNANEPPTQTSLESLSLIFPFCFSSFPKSVRNEKATPRFVTFVVPVVSPSRVRFVHLVPFPPSSRTPVSFD